MKNLLSAMPQWMLALLVLAGGVAVLLLFDPPVSVCRAQMEALDLRLVPFLKPDPKRKLKTKTGFQSSYEVCLSGNSPGACRELFDGTRKTLAELTTLDNECWPQVSSAAEIMKLFKDVVQLMSQIAWGEKAPADRIDKLAWFDAYHLNTFCDVKKTFIRVSGEPAWNEMALTQIQTLPQAGQLDSQEAWARSLFSVSCAQYR